MAVTSGQTDKLVSRIDATYQNLIAEGIPLGSVAGEMMARGHAAIFNIADMEVARWQTSPLLRNLGPKWPRRSNVSNDAQHDQRIETGEIE